MLNRGAYVAAVLLEYIIGPEKSVAESRVAPHPKALRLCRGNQ